MSQHSQYVDSLLKVRNCVHTYVIIIIIHNLHYVFQEFADFSDQIVKIERYVNSITTTHICIYVYVHSNYSIDCCRYTYVFLLSRLG